jgi:hypothetical protein
VRPDEITASRSLEQTPAAVRTLLGVVGARAQTLLEMMFFIERSTLGRAWSNLTDEEYLFEPVPGAWSIHPLAECSSANPWPSGDWGADYDLSIAMGAMAGGPPEPMTTIAWLYWHMGSMPGRTAELEIFGGPHATESGWSSPYVAVHPIFPTAVEAVTELQTGWNRLRAGLLLSTDEQLQERVRFSSYDDQPGPEATGAQVVASVLNEVSHHATQICVLRDLYRAR